MKSVIRILSIVATVSFLAGAPAMAQDDDVGNGIHCTRFVPMEAFLKILKERYHEEVKLRLHSKDGTDIILAQSPDGSDWTLTLVPSEQDSKVVKGCPFANEVPPVPPDSGRSGT